MKYTSLLLSAVFALMANVAIAQTTNDKDLIILSPSEIDRVIGNYPAPGSVMDAEDVETLMKLQENRTAQDCQAAASQESVSLATLFGGKNGPLTQKEIDSLTVEMLKPYGEAGANAYIGKKLYGRPRPYKSHRQIKPCIALEESESYPSGHATVARVLARLLAKKFPARADAFMKRANQAALNRLIGGVHYPSDVMAGIRLGDYLADKMIADQNRNRRR